MADIETALPPPPPQQAQQPRWASAAAALRGVADVLVCSYVTAMWVNAAANAAAVFSRWACGEDSPAAAVTMEVSMATVLAMGALTPFASPVLLSRLLERPEAAREEGGGGGGGGGGAKAHLSRRDSSGGARGRQDGGFVGRVVVLFMVFACCVAFVGVMLRDFAPEKGSCQERVGSILADIGVFAGSAMVCFVAAPNLLIFVTRSRGGFKAEVKGGIVDF